jgi:hypothetical protein
MLHLGGSLQVPSLVTFRVIDTIFREEIYSRWCCIDRLSIETWRGARYTMLHLIK